MSKSIKDLIVFKDGESVNGELLTSKFVLKTKYGQLPISKADILAIEYKNPPFSEEDEVQATIGSCLSGELFPEVIQFRFENTSQTLNIPKSDIHSIVFFVGRTRRLSGNTRKALKQIGRS